MKKILFPTDFSAITLRAFRYVLHLADQINATIVTYHTYEVPIPIGTTGGAAMEIYKEVVERRPIEELDDYQKFVTKLRAIAAEEGKENIELSHLMQERDVVGGIVEACESEACDLLVMSTRGANAFKHVFVGTNTSTILKKVKCPTLVIPDDAIFKSVKSIVYATDLNLTEENTVVDVIQLANLFKSKLHFIHINEPNSEWDKAKLDRFKEFYWLEEHSENIEVVVLESLDAVLGINRYVRDRNIDWVVMYAHEHGWLERLFTESYTQQMAKSTQVPLLIYHEGTGEVIQEETE